MQRNYLFPIAVALCAVLFHSVKVKATDIENAYAGPGVYGPPCLLRAHLSAKTYTVSYTAIGKTLVVGQVTYVNEQGQTVTVEFNGSITFRTGNAVAQPSVRFKGIPTGSAVTVN